MTKFRIGDRPALLAHPRLAESGISRQLPLILFTVDYVLPRRPGLRYVAGADYRGMLHRDGPSRRLRVTAGVVAIVARQAAAIANFTAVLMIIPSPSRLLMSDRSVPMSPAPEMSLESRGDTERPNLGCFRWQGLVLK